jgi:DNA (cytosine-5)-methyltransferase 1
VIYGSVCSGIEAATVAWEPLGWQPAWFAEIDAFASAVLAHRFPEVRNLGDFTSIRGHWLRRIKADPIDLLVGGTPCQAFSVAGQRLGLDDPRGNLTLEFLRLVKRLRPRWIVWENVPGVLSINAGRTFGTVLGTMVELGYGVAYRILDAQFFGVPQRRRRVFVVGHLGRRQAAAAVLFERESLRRDLAPRRKARQGVAALTAHGVGTCGGDDTQAQSGRLIPFGGNNTSGPIEVATACNAHGGAGRMDFETETICVEIAPPLLAGAMRTGSDRFPGMSIDTCEALIAHTLRGEGMDASEDGAGRGVPILPVGFSCKDSGADAMEDMTPTLRAMGSDESHPNGGGQLAVAFRGFGQDGFIPREIAPPVFASDGGTVDPPVVFESRFARNGRGAPGVIAPPLKAQSGASGRGDGAPLLATWVAVRRLTPRECERLQGFPDDHTLIPNYRQKLRPNEVEEMAAYLGMPLDEARRLGATPDGPRYKAIGNSMAVPVMVWIGARIDHVDRVLRDEETLR